MASYFFIDLRHRWAMHNLISFDLRCQHAASPRLAPGYLAVFAGPPAVKNQRATQNGVDKKHGSDDGNGRCQFHPGRAEGVATSQERSTKVMLLGKRMGKFSILRAKTFW